MYTIKCLLLLLLAYLSYLIYEQICTTTAVLLYFCIQLVVLGQTVRFHTVHTVRRYGRRRIFLRIRSIRRRKRLYTNSHRTLRCGAMRTFVFLNPPVLWGAEFCFTVRSGAVHEVRCGC